MSKILIVYGSTFGQTAKIVRHIADLLEREGHAVTVRNADDLPATWSPDAFDGFVVAASVLGGRHQRDVRDFVQRQVTTMNNAPSAFVSVCGALAGTSIDGKREARKYVDAFLGETGWHPQLARSFAGALKYRDYSLPIRWMMKFISWRTGRPTDTSRNYEFTDWERVDRFARELAVGFRELAPVA